MPVQCTLWLNRIANALGSVLLAPIAWLPGWISATLIGAVTGVLMLVVFKYTSNQAAIRRTRDRIKANTLALSLFKDSLWVSLRCQARLLGGAFMLLWHALLPMAVMTIPMILVLGQLALWYQARPLRPGESSIVTVQLDKASAGDVCQTIQLVPNEAVVVLNGPVRVPEKSMVCWDLSPSRQGSHRLEFVADGEKFEKEYVAGNGFQPTSLKRPAGKIGEMLIHPRETPFAAGSPVQSIEITYPDRDSFTSGTNNWLIYWFIVSIVVAFVAKPFLKVDL